MKKYVRCALYALVSCLCWSGTVWGEPDTRVYSYFRSVPLTKSADQRALRRSEERVIAGVDLADYGYAGVLQYAIASPEATLVVLGETDSKELVVSAIDLVSRDSTVLMRFEAHELQDIRTQNINMALCFQDHSYSSERLRYIFLTYIVDSVYFQSETYLKVFRMENEDVLTFTEMLSRRIGETNSVYQDSSDAPYTYLRHESLSEPGIQIVPRLLLADVNHDKFMDLVIWRRIYLANPRDADAPLEEQHAYEQRVFKQFTRDREEVQVMFFDWEKVSFAEPVTTQTEALGNDVFWRFLFPSYWAQDYYDWMKSPSE